MGKPIPKHIKQLSDPHILSYIWTNIVVLLAYILWDNIGAGKLLTRCRLFQITRHAQCPGNNKSPENDKAEFHYHRDIFLQNNQ